MHIINKLRLTQEGLVVKGTRQLVHLQQGTLDGACAVYSLMMCLIINKAIKRADVVNLAMKHDKRTSKGRLVDNFLNNNGMVRNGYYLNDLKDELHHTFSKNITTEYYNLDSEGLITKRIVEALDNDNSVEIVFQRLSSAHAVVAIGYEKIADNVYFFCLDPGYPISEGQYWNNVIMLGCNSNRKYNCLNFKEKSRVMIDEILIVHKR